MPMTEKPLVNFLASLFDKGYRVNTIAAYVSALSYINKLFGFGHFRQSFLVKQFLKGASNLASNEIQSDTRLPITSALLQQILQALPHTINNYLHRITFSTMCVLAFNGFLRIGEICSKSSDTSSMLQFHDIRLISSHDGPMGLEMTLRKYKLSSDEATLFMPVNPTNQILCPVAALRLYLLHASHSAGPFFQFPNGEAVTYAFFNAHLKK